MRNQLRRIPRVGLPNLRLNFQVIVVGLLAMLANSTDSLSLPPTRAEDSRRVIEVPNAVIKVAEQAMVPATDPGVIIRLLAKEGQIVEEGELLANLRDSVERLALERAELEASIAGRKAENSLNVQYAKKSSDVARAELARSEETNAKYPKTVSKTELDRQRLVREKGELETKQAQEELEIAAISKAIRENERRMAQEALERRSIRSPLRGMVVELPRQRGEWVQPGENIARVVRLDKLRVEGFAPVEHARPDLLGREVQVVVGSDRAATRSTNESPVRSKAPASNESEHEGPRQNGGPAYRATIVFVSPEVDTLNNQVRIWAEVDNTDLSLRPGMPAILKWDAR